MTSLQFSGDIGTIQGFTLALIVGAAAWLLYYRQVRKRSGLTAYALPTLRGIAAFLLILMLTQPVLHHRETIGELGRVYLVIDASKSMNVRDLDADLSRKLESAVARGKLAGDFMDKELQQAAVNLEQAHHKLSYVLNKNAPLSTLREPAERYVEALEEGLGQKHKLAFELEPEIKTGSINAEIWNGIGGSNLKDLLKSKKFRNDPDQVERLTKLDVKRGDDSFGLRIRGYLVAPEDGKYKFWIAGDDESALFLSTDAGQENKKEIARVGWSGYRQWNDKHSSSEIELKAGQHYYIEVLSKEGGGDAYVSVGWQLPGGKKERPIPGQRIAPLDGKQKRAPADFVAMIKKATKTWNNALDDKKRNEAISAMRQLLVHGETIHAALRSKLEQELQKLAESGQPAVIRAIQNYDQSSRWTRLQNLLFDGEAPIVKALSEEHEVELLALKGTEVETLWRSKSGALNENAEVPAFLKSTPSAAATDLTQALQVDAQAQKTAVVMFTDGRDNHGEPPLGDAKILGRKGIQVYTVGFGSQYEPQDLAVRSIETADSVYIKDHARGVISFADTMKPGKAFSVRVRLKNKVIWEEKLETNGSGMRRVEFDFPVEEHVKELLNARDKDLDYRSIPVDFQAEISEVPGDRQAANNRSNFEMTVATRKRSILLIDGRARWEWRYLKAMFSRDEKWEINSVLPKRIEERYQFKRGDEEGQLPKSIEDLMKYDLVILGDVQKSLFRDEELDWLQTFVSRRGGGLILIDGRRGYMRELFDSSLKELSPVKWENPLGHRNGSGYALTDMGKQLSALNLGSEEKENDSVWQGLPKPHWLASVSALPGAEVLAQTRLRGENGQAGNAAKKAPALVLRRYGSGKVLYSAIGEFWRWRYRKADTYHRRFWNQVTDWMMEEPFNVRDQYVALDAGPSRYEVGQQARIRARIFDEEGKPLRGAEAEAVLTRDGKVFAKLPLDEDKASGIYSARSGELSPGAYSVTVKVKQIPEGRIKAQTSFDVREPTSLELSELSCNEQLLQKIAVETNGQYFREEQTSKLMEILKPLSSGRVVETDTALWQSYWYFWLVVALLTVEWVWRKKRGLM